MEDLIIEAIYAGIIQAKLDQKNAQVCLCMCGRLKPHGEMYIVRCPNVMQLEVECFIGRDIKMDSIPVMIQKLESW